MFVGSQRNGRLHHQPQRVRPHVLLFQPAAGRLHLLAACLESRSPPVSSVPSAALRTDGCVTLHRPRHHHQPLRHDRSPDTIPKVRISYQVC